MQSPGARPIRAVATISNAAGSNGLATSVSAGSTTITAASGSISGSTTLTVTPATLVSIEVTPANPSIAKGTSKQFTATGTYSDNTTQNLTTAVTWSSSNTSSRDHQQRSRFERPGNVGFRRLFDDHRDVGRHLRRRRPSP